MLTLSVATASLGLSSDCAATVIGAMIVAPLGQPIIALGVWVALGWPRDMLRMLGLVAVGMVTVVAISYGIGLLPPSAAPSGQMLARTAPDLRDLGVALFAGAAGAFGYCRSDYSGVLAGVAIAVALVPPLCTVDLMPEDGRYELATGALLLFAANFFGIALASITVFMLTGIARRGAGTKWFAAGLAAILGGGLLVAMPLTVNFDRFTGAVSIQRQVHLDAARIAQAASGDPQIANIAIQGTQATIALDKLPADKAEVDELTTALQRATDLQIVLTGG